jgi:hypothetical protein
VSFYARMKPEAMAESGATPMITDLHERLEELAEAAAGHGRTPEPEAALRRGRQRQWRLAVGGSALAAVVLFAVVVAYDQAGRTIAECQNRPGSAGARCG